MGSAPVSDARWLAVRGFRTGAGGYLEELPVSRAADWILAFLAVRGGSATGSAVHDAAAAAGFSGSTLKRARRLAGATAARHSNGRGAWTVWALPGSATATAAAPGVSAKVEVRAS